MPVYLLTTVSLKETEEDSNVLEVWIKKQEKIKGKRWCCQNLISINLKIM